MDQFAHRIANILVGNEESEGALEMTLIGPTLAFEEDALIPDFPLAVLRENGANCRLSPVVPEQGRF